MTCIPLLVLLLAGQPMPTLSPELARVETLLRNENLPTDGPGLLAYLRTQTRLPEDDVQLRRWITQLGDDDFETRERASRQLLEAGRKAVPYLTPALGSADREVVRRARLCLDSILEGPLASMMPAIVRLLGERRPTGTVPVLLAYLPSAGEEATEEAIFDLLRKIGVREGKLCSDLISAFSAPAPLVRAAAAHITGDLPNTARDRRLLLSLLTDPAPRVRFEAAQARIRGGAVDGIPVLIDLVRTGPANQAFLADEVLARLAGNITIPTLNESDAGRKATADGWKRWWAQTARRADWAVPHDLVPYFGRTLIVEFDTKNSSGAVCEVGRDGNRRWQIDGLKGPNDAQPLPNGHILIAERGLDRVGEFDRSGKLHWSYRTSNSPIACQRLADGTTTLVVTFNEMLLVDREGKELFSHRCDDGLRHARVLPDGRLLAITAKGEILELTREGKEQRRIRPDKYAEGASYWASVVALPEERYLAALGSSNKVVEMDRTGKIEKEWDVPSPVSVVRLRNGHTLVASFEGRVVVELDREGKEVWKVTTPGRLFFAMRY